MKIKFEVIFDTETKLFHVESNDVKISHSGSSYLRINGENIYGTIGTPCPGPFIKDNYSCEDNLHLCFNIQKETTQ
jgi:hypothetical protein